MLQRQQQQQWQRRDEHPVVAAVSSAGAAASSWPAGTSSSSSSSSSSSYEGGGRRKSTTTRAASSASSASTSRGRELIDAIADLPWQRIGVWAVVSWAAYQLKDFFGVSVFSVRFDAASPAAAAAFGGGGKGGEKDGLEIEKGDSEGSRRPAFFFLFLPTSSLSLFPLTQPFFTPPHPLSNTHSLSLPPQRSSWEPSSSLSSATASSAPPSRRASSPASSRARGSGAECSSPGISP